MELLDPIVLGNLAAVISAVFVLFQMLVLLGVIPQTIVWGGRISDRRRLIRMELVSLISVFTVGSIAFFSAGP